MDIQSDLEAYPETCSYVQSLIKRSTFSQELCSLIDIFKKDQIRSPNTDYSGVISDLKFLLEFSSRKHISLLVA